MANKHNGRSNCNVTTSGAGKNAMRRAYNADNYLKSSYWDTTTFEKERRAKEEKKNAPKTIVPGAWFDEG